MTTENPASSAGAAQSTPPVTLREFRYPEDYPAVRALWEQAGPGVHVARSDAPEEIEKKLRRDPDLFLVAEAGGQIVGSVIGGFDGRRGLVYHLAVAPAFRRSGMGTRLMDEVERRLRAKGCIKSYLLVVPGDEEITHFYEARGWERMEILIYGKELA